MVCLEGILYKGKLASNPRCSRRQRINEADISAPVEVDQSAVNYLEEDVRSFHDMRIRCRSSRADVTLRHLMQGFRVVRSWLVRCFQTRITVKLFRCTRAPMAR
ncbi:uncharacterized protein TNCV_3470291 [Trichonephila clavipes]|nr:uncharacterized protein TNCV_3470291 [Trichonephila clavipes]